MANPQPATLLFAPPGRFHYNDGLTKGPPHLCETPAMIRNTRLASCLLLALSISTFSVSVHAEEAALKQPTGEGLKFFEEKIRPVLVERCYKCHSAEAAKNDNLKGELLLDSRDGLRKGGESGPAVVPGDVEASLLIAAIRHESFEMPPDTKLDSRVIADFVKWVEMGAPDPRDGTAVERARSTTDIEAGRAFWSFQPLKRPPHPR